MNPTFTPCIILNFTPSIIFFSDFYDLFKEDFETATTYIYYLADIMKAGGSPLKSKELLEALNKAVAAVLKKEPSATIESVIKQALKIL